MREFIQDFDLAPSLIGMRAAFRILRHVLKQDFRGGDGVGAPIQLLVGGDARFMAAPSVHQPTPSQRQASAAELDKNHGVTLTEFIEFLCHIADAACGRQKWAVSSIIFQTSIMFCFFFCVFMYMSQRIILKTDVVEKYLFLYYFLFFSFFFFFYNRLFF